MKARIPGFEYCAGFQQPRRLRHGGREYLTTMLKGSTGVIVSGTVTETGPDIDFSIDGVPRPMAGWTCRVHRD